MTFSTINPYNNEVIAEYSFLTTEALHHKIEHAAIAYKEWRKTKIKSRCLLIEKLAALLRLEATNYAPLVSNEMGKPVSEARAEISKCAWLCEYYAEHATKFLKPETVELEVNKAYVQFDPIGGVLGIMPWNYPFWQVIRFAIPAILAGNVVFLKHAPNTTGTALQIEHCFKTVGFPEHVFQTLVIDVPQVSDVIAHPLVQGIALTGSEKAGAAVAAQAGEQIKKTVLELGGSDPFIVLEDADVQAAAEAACLSRMMNTGQSCIAAKRLIVVKEVAEDFIAAFKKQVSALKIGNPLDEQTQIGVIARPDLADDLEVQVQKAVKEGAKIILGGKRNGNFYEPTILTDVDTENTVFKEETFGPVAAITIAKNQKEAIKFANLTRYGLGASVWTKNIDNADKIASKIEAGNVFFNQIVKSDPRLPFGGIKKSGYGRELSSYAMREFVNIKSVSIL
ncbi:MAG: NAD-dependent succinate-semialdehyde dehydrogenase [Bernardetiaceae bacterium]|nr:NAD-dependent succinate-semialdehyde dehydrogenase [Bernardetiaceae bacterium]